MKKLKFARGAGSVRLRWWRFSSIMSTAVTMSAAVCHAMELPAKMRYDPSLYVMLHRTLYPSFGRTAGIAEIAAVLSTGALAWRVRNWSPAAFPLSAAAAGCLAVAHGIFWIAVQPANSTMASWELDEIPPGWSRWRNRWEYAHAARAFLVTTALGALVLSVLQEK